MSVKPVPDGYNRACPYLICENAEAVVRFAQAAFGAEERDIMRMPDGKIAHAEVKIGDSVIMISDGDPAKPKMPATVHVYVENADEVYAKAIAAGATSEHEMETMIYGDRSGGVKDMGGNIWWIATRVKDVSPAELAEKLKSMQKPAAS